MTKIERALLNDAARLLRMTRKGFEPGMTLEFMDDVNDWLTVYDNDSSWPGRTKPKRKRKVEA